MRYCCWDSNQRTMDAMGSFRLLLVISQAFIRHDTLWASLRFSRTAVKRSPVSRMTGCKTQTCLTTARDDHDRVSIAAVHCTATYEVSWRQLTPAHHVLFRRLCVKSYQYPGIIWVSTLWILWTPSTIPHNIPIRNGSPTFKCCFMHCS